MKQYVHALHQLALEKEKLDVLNYQFDEFKQMVDDYPSWLEMMNSPVLSQKKKDEQIDALPLDPTFLSFLKVLTRKAQMRHFPELYEEWTHLVRVTQKIVHLHVISVKPLTKAQEARLIETLKPRYPEQTITLHQSTDPELIGGIKVLHQGLSLDRTILRELEELFITI